MPILLLTGAIDLRKFNVPFTKIIDLEERLEQYKFSLEYSIENYSTITKIVFCENTGYDFDYSYLSKRANTKGKKFEYLTFPGNYDQIQKLGKGFGEGEIIKYALENSRLLNTESSFYKLTGRLIVKNFDLLVTTTTRTNAFIYRQKDITDRTCDYIETYFYKVEIDLYNRYLLNSYQSCDDQNTNFLEHVFCKDLYELPLRSFKYQPLISGLLGTSGEIYDLKLKRKLIESLYFATGVYNLKKTFKERLFMNIWIRILKIKRFIGISYTGLGYIRL
jgi:hypothetical protein